MQPGRGSSGCLSTDYTVGSGGTWSATDKRRYGTVTRLNPVDALHWCIEPGARRDLRSQNSFHLAYDARGLLRIHPGIAADGADSARQRCVLL